MTAANMEGETMLHVSDARRIEARYDSPYIASVADEDGMILTQRAARKVCREHGVKFTDFIAAMRAADTRSASGKVSLFDLADWLGY